VWVLLGCCAPATLGDELAGMRPRVEFALLVGALLCLILAVFPFQTETRLVGLGGLVVFVLMYVAERRRGHETG
jgi:hypothetical protein